MVTILQHCPPNAHPDDPGGEKAARGLRHQCLQRQALRHQRLRQGARMTKLIELSLMRHPVRTVNIHEAKTHLSKLLEEAVNGEPFIIAKAGKPLVVVTKVDAKQLRRTGFLEGRFSVPDDFDQMGAEEIVRLFEGEPD